MNIIHNIVQYNQTTPYIELCVEQNLLEVQLVLIWVTLQAVHPIIDRLVSLKHQSSLSRYQLFLWN